MKRKLGFIAAMVLTSAVYAQAAEVNETETAEEVKIEAAIEEANAAESSGVELTVEVPETSISSKTETQNLTKEILDQREKQKLEDKARADEEKLLAQERSDESNERINSLRLQYEETARTLKNNFLENNTPDNNIEYIETIKANLFDLRAAIDEQIAEYNAQIDEKTAVKIEEIQNEPLKITEKNEYGFITTAAKDRRNALCEQAKIDGEAIKAAYKIQQDEKKAEDNKNWLPQLKAAYTILEGTQYKVNTLGDALSVRVGNYDGETGTWKFHVTSELFGYVNLFDETFDLSYKEVTGKKKTDVSKMKDEELAEYNSAVETYDSLFRSATPVFYVELTYTLMRWRGASEYHFIPQKVEIIQVAEENKVVHKVAKDDLNPKTFVVNPAVDIRFENEKERDFARAAKVIEAEQKIIQKRKDALSRTKVASYNDLYNPYSKNATDRAKEVVANASNEKKKTYVGRKSVYLNSSYQLNNLFEKNDLGFGDLGKPVVLNMEAHFTFNMGKFVWLGLGAGYENWNFGNLGKYVSEENAALMKKPTFLFTIDNGVAWNPVSFLRLFANFGPDVYFPVYNPIDYNGDIEKALNDPFYTYQSEFAPGSDTIFGLHTGAGIDLIIPGGFMFTVSGEYNWMYYIHNFRKYAVIGDEDIASVMKAFKTPDFGAWEITVGLGYTF